MIGWAGVWVGTQCHITADDCNSRLGFQIMSPVQNGNTHTLDNLASYLWEEVTTCEPSLFM